MKKVRVLVEAILEVYVEDDVTEEKAESIASDIALEQVRRLDKTECGNQDPYVYLASYGTTITDCEEVDCE